MDEKTRRTIGTTLAVGGTIVAASSIIAATALISDIKVNKEADRAIQKAQGFVAEMLIDKNPNVRESAKKGLAYMRNFLVRG